MTEVIDSNEVQKHLDNFAMCGPFAFDLRKQLLIITDATNNALSLAFDKQNRIQRVRFDASPEANRYVRR